MPGGHPTIRGAPKHGFGGIEIHWQRLIPANHLAITNNEYDKIGKEAMRKAFLAMYPDKHLTTIQVMTALKERDIKYNSNLRGHDKVRGCYYGVKFATMDEDDDDEEELKKGIDTTYQSIDPVKELKRQLEELQAKYNALQKKHESDEVDEKPKKVDKSKKLSDEEQKKVNNVE